MRNFIRMGCVAVSAAFLSLAAQSAASAQDPPHDDTTTGTIQSVAQGAFPNAPIGRLNLTPEAVEAIYSGVQGRAQAQISESLERKKGELRE
ncbi:hypothetical protein [Nonomuraea turcica]|uniref:hypothetical protein n=1 Tax=Nonomuraea sp. G32 TaxID=3067274 RepID=UPI00273AD233|nr:hypothetical protein [Nonomuraea sp. G32]MDP4508018.1 hypothetical protein [Nonomuraea sp. G32]